MKKIINIAAFFFLINICFGQDYKEHFDLLIMEGDTAQMTKLLTEWEAEEPENPELFTSYFNYYILKSRQSFMSISHQSPGGEGFQLIDSLGQVAGYFGEKVIYDQKTAQKGIDKIEEGISLYPDRLDMRFCKIYILGETEDWETYTQEIIKAIRYSGKNNNEWTWTFNEALEDGKEIFHGNLQSYQVDLFLTEDDDLLNNIRLIAEEILNLHPGHIESLTNIGNTYLVTADYEKAIEFLSKAKNHDPGDVVVLSNIAFAYQLKGDIATSINYYEKLLEFDDPEVVQFAKQQIQALKN